MSIKLSPPAQTSSETASVLKSAGYSVLSREQILIVDDSATIRKMFSKCLTRFYNCFEAASASEALSLLKADKFGLVITDVMMPGISGIELLRKIIETYPDTAVIMVSGVNQPKRALDAVRLGAFDYLFKPCEMDVLEITVERALERRQLLLNARQHKLDLQARNDELAQEKAKLEQLQAQIIHSGKMASLGQMAAGIAHELNNPVGFIFGNMDVLSKSISDLSKLLAYYDGCEMPKTITDKAELIKKQVDYDRLLEDLASIIADSQEGADRIRQIVQNLRTFSRLDEPECAVTDLHEGIDSTIRLLSHYFKTGNIKLICDFGKIPRIFACSSQLNQVWMNLLINAAQAIGSGSGEVKITTRATKDLVIVSVSDSGKGISSNHLTRIFDPFYTTKPVGEGTGLGLSISFGIIQRHQGKIEVKSRLNAGTTFFVTLPINNLNPN